MKKEKLTKEQIQSDLLLHEKRRFWDRSRWLVDCAIGFALIPIPFCVLFQTLWIALPFGLMIAVLVGVLLRELTVWHLRSKRIRAGAFTVGTGSYSGTADEWLFRPSIGRGRFCFHDRVRFWQFSNGQWQVFFPANHYAWSKLYAMSHQGLENVTLEGDEYYTVCLLGDTDLGYVYPTKLFDYEKQA